MNKTVVIVIIVVLAGLGGVLALTRKSSAPSSSTTSTSNTDQTSAKFEEPTNQPSAETATITYTNDGFSPASLTVKAGTKVTIKNSSSNPLQFDSDPHPEHTANPELNIGFVSEGESKTFTVTKSGSHGYHNHLRSGDTGTLVVE